MKKIIIFFTIVFLIGIGALFLTRSFFQQKNIPLETQACAKEGQSIGSCVGCLSECCSGLKPLNKFVIDGKCVNFFADGGELICSDCGNGICDKKYSENTCNCPMDCK